LSTTFISLLTASATPGSGMVDRLCIVFRTRVFPDITMVAPACSAVARSDSIEAVNPPGRATPAATINGIRVLIPPATTHMTVAAAARRKSDQEAMADMAGIQALPIQATRPMIVRSIRAIDSTLVIDRNQVWITEQAIEHNRLVWIRAQVGA